MALPSGTISSPNAGQLIVNFAGVYTATSLDFGSGASDIRVKCQVFDASSVLKGQGLLSRLNGQVTLFIDYPGGNASWTVTASEIDYEINGAGSVSVALAIKARLAKL